MDTRTKIVTTAEARRLASEGLASESGLTIVSGYFDPLLSWHARRLSELKTELKAGLKRESTALLVLIGTPKDPILPARARAELVAGLAVVDHVAELAPGLTPHVRLESEDDGCFENLLELVHARQRASS